MADQLSQWLDAHQLLAVSVLIPLISAIVAATSSWYSTRRALRAEQAKMGFQGLLKISEFRQQWINDLRDAMSEYQSYGVLPDFDPTSEREFYRLGTKIELLMNPSDPDYDQLSSVMYDFMAVSDGDTAEKYSKNSEFVSLCQKILKREWEKLKFDLQCSIKL